MTLKIERKNKRSDPLKARYVTSISLRLYQKVALDTLGLSEGLMSDICRQAVDDFLIKGYPKQLNEAKQATIEYIAELEKNKKLEKEKRKKKK